MPSPAANSSADPHGLAPWRRMPAALLIGAVRAYQATLGPWLGGHCRFRPTCSQYMIDALRKYGAVRGAWRGLRRVVRCHPWGGMGDDPA